MAISLLKNLKQKHIMQNKKHGTAGIEYYQPLLQRYARRLLKNEVAARELVTKVLKDQFEFNSRLPSARVRQLLKVELLNHCFYWQQAQIFDRPLITVPLRKK